MTTTYADFLATRIARTDKPGPLLLRSDVHPMLHDWQAELVLWALRTGRAALWADTGLGKTLMQVEWARLASEGGTSLIVAPLAVCAQTVREAAKVGVTANYVRHGSEITGPGVWVTNYEMVPHFPAHDLDAVVLDEASILKQSDGKTRTMLIEHFSGVPSNPGETVLTPFLGIGSEAYEAVKLGRKAIGIELKPSYWNTAVDNLRRLDSEMSVPSLFDDVA